MRIFTFCCFLLFSFGTMLGALSQSVQRGEKILLKNGIASGQTLLSESNVRKINQGVHSTFKRTFVVIQFERTPSNEEKNQLKNDGIQLLDYIPNHAYSAMVTSEVSLVKLKKYKTRTIWEPTADQKISLDLVGGEFPAHAVKENGKLDVWISYPRALSYPEVLIELVNSNFNVVSDLHKDYRILELRVPISRLKELAEMPIVEYVQAIPANDLPVNDKSIATSRANVLSTILPGGRNLTGSGIVIGVGDNGDVATHTDLKDGFVNRAAIKGEKHGVHVMGTLVGKGLIREQYRGYAPEATIVTQNFSRILSSSPIFVRDYGMSITNNSYGADVVNCGTYGTYDLYSGMLDQQAFQLPYLQHVFAAGNGTIATTCSPLPAGFGTIYGGYQTAKNIISVGNIASTGAISGLSSRGPTKDGRIKPELVSVGNAITSTVPGNSYEAMSGTSMATPSVAGGLALLYERFKELHGRIPKNGLMKAMVCNGATDGGNAGPDFSYGFGVLNLERSVKILENNFFRNDSLEDGGVKDFTLAVPASTAQLKVMLYWNDPAASILASKTLVNDLDLEVYNSSNNLVLPKLLNSVGANVLTVAGTGVDKLNNIEQVVIDNPQEGSYKVRVKGSSIVQNPRQEYFIVYDIVPVSVVVANPIGSERLVPGETFPIMWDSFGDTTSTFNVQYSVNNGVDWVNIQTNIASNLRRCSWVIPQNLSSQVRVRVVKKNSTEISATSEPLSIIGVPGNFRLADNQCETYINLEWDPVEGVTDYEVFLLKGTEMTAVGTTGELKYTLSGLSRDSTYLVSVRARLNDKPGRRATAIFRQPNSGLCNGNESNGDLLMDAILEPVTESGREHTSVELPSEALLKVRVKNLANVESTEAFQMGYFINDELKELKNVSAVLPAGGTFNYTFSETEDLSLPGTYNFKVFIKKAGDPVAANDTIQKRFKQLANPAVTFPNGVFDDIELLPDQSLIGSTSGLEGADRFDFISSTPVGRLRTSVNSSFAPAGNKGLTLDSEKFIEAGNTNYLIATYNLSNYSLNDDIRLDFKFRVQGQTDRAENRVWIRGSDTQSWIEIYNLAYNQNPITELDKVSSRIQISTILRANSQTLSSSFQVRWGQWGQVMATNDYSGSGYTFDDIKLYRVQQDLELIAIQTPVDRNCGMGNSEEIVVNIRNNSDEVFNSVPIRYSIDGGPEHREEVPTLEPNDTRLFSFQSRVNLSAFGAHHVKVWIDSPLDSYRTNDTIMLELYNTPVISSFPYLQNFESSYGWFHSKGKNDSWEYGEPNSPKINRAASGRKAWKTNLSGNYNDQEESYLYSPCFDISSMVRPTLSFNMALDLEACPSSVCDIVYVEYSFEGTSWIRLGTNFSGTNWYDKLISNIPFWSAQDYTRWHVATTPLPATLGGGSLRFRFVLNTNMYVNREGVAIDDIHIYDNAVEGGTAAGGIYTGGTMTTPLTKTNVTGFSWIHFREGNKLVASIMPNGQNLGTTSVQAFINSSAAVNVYRSNYVGDRNIVVKPTTQTLSDSVSLRFYFLDTESDRMFKAGNCPTCTAMTGVIDLGIAQYSDPVVGREDGSLDNNLSGEWKFVSPQNVVKVPFDRGYYAEFKVRDFSEFWLTTNLLGTEVSLPVELLSFTARRMPETESHDNVALEWYSASEKNSDRFEVEVARGNEELKKVQFTKIGELPAQGTSGVKHYYVLQDKELFKTGVRYYRLKMIDRDGSYSYSSIRSVVFEEDGRSKVYPNPSNGIFNLSYKASSGDVLQIKVHDVTGKLLSQKSHSVDSFTERQIIDITGSEYASGVYLIEVTGGSQPRQFKVIKN